MLTEELTRFSATKRGVIQRVTPEKPIMPENTLLLSNLVYGERYTDLYLDCHLPAILDGSNLPAIADRTYVELYTDEASGARIVAHPSWACLAALLSATIHVLPIAADGHAQRYGIQALTFHRSLHRAYAEDRALIYTAADIVYGAGVLPALLAKIDEGFDSVFGVPMRGTSEAMQGPLSGYGKALTAAEQYQLCRPALHPLWVASNWDAPDFSRIPYALLWSDASQIVLRPLTISNLIVKVNARMLGVSPTTPDAMIDPYVLHPYYADQWSDFPTVELQGLSSFWPPSRPGPANVAEYQAWAKQAAPAHTLPNLKRTVHFCDPTQPPTPESTVALMVRSDAVVAQILGSGALWP